MMTMLQESVRTKHTSSRRSAPLHWGGVTLGLALTGAGLFGMPAQAAVSVSPLFSDHMVMQAGMEVPVWGWAQRGERITVSMADQQHGVEADEQGRWMVRLHPLRAGARLEMTVAATNTITVRDILVGEVWVCSGQSNMQRPMRMVRDAEREIREAAHPEIRLFTVPSVRAGEPKATCGGKWVVCTPESVTNFSAVGYLFGRELHATLKTPVGLIHNSVGGTPIEMWIDYKVLSSAIAAAGEQAWPPYDPNVAETNFRAALATWTTAVERARAAGLPEPDKPRKTLDPRLRAQSASNHYNGMVHPLIPYAMRGVIWYQGEWNAFNAYWYRTLLPLLITDWRTRWGQGDFPFGIVQLANHGDVQTEPVEDRAWAEVREAQWLTSQRVRNTGLAVTIDTSEDGNLHPTNKQDVGHRLALWALSEVYARKGVSSGPVFDRMTVEGDAIRLHFKPSGSALVAREGGLKGFAIAGEDKAFRAATATIEGVTVAVRSPDVPVPVAVRYAWANNPVCNLYNQAGLPASPFRTDEWPGVTQPAP